MRRLLAVGLLTLAASCGQRSSEAPSAPKLATVGPASAGRAEAPPPAAPAAVAQSVASLANVALPQIAYAYDFTLELPAKAVISLFERHRRACEAAGPARCQIVAAETERVGGTDTSATLSLRAEAGWLAGFRAQLATDAAGASGAVTRSKTTSEDLGRDISDTAARVRALTTLQGRLEALLATRQGKLSDLLETERELARVGGDLDATRSALADMRGRVTLPKATVVYQPDSLVVASAGRGGGFGGQLYDIATGSLMALISLLAAALPWLVVGGPLVWLLRRWWRRRRA